MNKSTFRTFVILTAAATVIVAASRASSRLSSPVIVTGEIHPPGTIVSPANQMIEVGADATFSVTEGLGWKYQWLRNGTPMKGEKKSTLTLVNAQTGDAGNYSCNVKTGRGVVTNNLGNLLVFVVVDPDPDIVVYSLPICYAGGGGNCPGPYKGYVNYTFTNYWGWMPATNETHLFTASDTNRPNTKIQYVGYYGDNGCAVSTVTVPYPPPSPQYGFTIYFTNNVPTSNYPITLIGFNLP
ncbi:MAG TPA: immunoglobulin domain-containing protein [Verrucomicrobiae bacterium]|jgi:hypothetical protein